jgi:hypothetical protein
MRSFVWWVIGGLAVGGILVVHAGLQIFRAFPETTRAAAVGAIRARPRVAAVGGALAAWMLLYALYSIGYPSTVATPTQAASRTRRPPPQSSARQLGGVGALPSLLGADVLPAPLDAADSLAAPTPTTPAAPAPGGAGGTAPVVCSVEDAANSVREAQAAAEALTGRPFGADMGAVIEAVAGCKDPTNTALSLLGPVNQLLNDAGIPTLPLPAFPALPPFFLPGEVSEPLRPVVFEACGNVLRQIYTLAAVAPVARIEFDDAVAVGNYVAAICGAFAPEPPA